MGTQHFPIDFIGIEEPRETDPVFDTQLSETPRQPRSIRALTHDLQFESDSPFLAAGSDFRKV